MSIIKPYTAEADIEGNRLVTFGTEEGSVKAAAAATDVVIGRTCFAAPLSGQPLISTTAATVKSNLAER